MIKDKDKPKITFKDMIGAMPKVFRDCYTKNMKQDRKITEHRDGALFLQHNEECQKCGVFYKVLEARRCSNGFFSWRCESCWKE